jgi:hypothetical protein
LPRNIVDRPDGEIIERIFGKRLKRELDKIAKGQKGVTDKGASHHLS